MNVLKVAVAAACVVMLTACSTELILERDNGGEPAPVEVTETPAEPAAETLSRAEGEPEPVAIAYGDCLNVDQSGQSVRFSASVACEGLHDAEVYESTTIDEDPLPLIRDWCHDQLPNSLKDDNRGKAYALVSPAGFVHNQGVAGRGDEVFCVYVHAEASEEGFAEPRSEDDDEEDGDS